VRVTGFPSPSAACIFTLLIGCFGAEPVSGQEASVATAVTTAVVEKRQISAVVHVSGTVLPRNEVFVTPQAGGLLIRQVRVEEGDWVEEGELLVRLQRDVYEIELARAEAEEARAASAIRQALNQISASNANAVEIEADLARISELFERGNVSEATYDEAVAAAEAARAEAASAQDALAIAEAERSRAELQREIAGINLSWTEITAPVNGIVGVRNAKVGALTATSGDPLLTIHEGGALELVAEVIETSLGSIEPGDGGAIDVAGVGPLVGIVRLISPTVNPTTRLGEVRITLQGVKGLRSGLFGSGVIETERRMALTVPLTAILSDPEGDYVQIVKDGIVERRSVIPNLVWQGRREIVSGLEEGETVIARSGAFFRDGDRVRAVEPEQDGEP
jgi:RND family efflux transporter MFP subunit